MGIVEQYLSQLNMKKQRFRRNVAFMTALSLLVVFAVSWNLRQTGIAIANDICKNYRREGLFFDELLDAVLKGE